MIFIWSVFYSRCVSFVMICSGNFAWSRCCGLLLADCSKGMRSPPARRWNSGSGERMICGCGSGWWEWLVRAEHSSGSWRIDVSLRHGKPRASFGVVMFGCQTKFLLPAGLSPTILLILWSPIIYSWYGTGCPSWCVGDWLALLHIAAVHSFLRLLLAFLMSAWMILGDVSSVGCRCWMSLWLETWSYIQNSRCSTCPPLVSWQVWYAWLVA